MEATQKHRLLYKIGSPNWKDTYRKRCVERMKNSRSRLLDRYRQVANCSPGRGCPSLLVQEVMEEEWQQLHLSNSGLPSLWRGADFSQVLLRDPDELTLLQEIKQELIFEERCMIEEIEKVLNFEEECLNSVINLNSGNHVVCPVCNRNYLTVTSHFILCPCSLHINTHSRSLTAEKLQSLLECHLLEHQGWCSHHPVFSVGTGVEGETNLFLSCQVCDTVAVIL